MDGVSQASVRAVGSRRHDVENRRDYPDFKAFQKGQNLLSCGEDASDAGCEGMRISTTRPAVLRI